MPNNELLSLLIDQIKENSNKLDEMKDAYYQLKGAVESHQIVDEKMHQDVCEFMESANKKLDDYNRQLEIHIAGTIENRKDINEFKATIKPLIDGYVEETIIKKARKKAINKWTMIAGFVAAVGGAVGAILKLMNLI